MKGDVVIADFPMTSLKFKLQNYRSDLDFTLMMYLIEQLKTYKSGENISPDIS